MGFSINDLATELGIDVSTLKPDAVSKWNGYLTQADTQYRESSQSKKDALDALEAAKREQAAIDEQIKKYGETEVTTSELRAANAALTAALEEVKKSGFNVNMPNLPTHKAEPVDPNKALQDKMTQGFSLFGKALKVQNKYQSIFGKPFADDIEALANEASQQRMDMYDYAAKKFDFAGEESRRQKEAQTAHDAQVSAAAVKKYQEDNPRRTPMDERGVASRHPQIFKPRDAAEGRKFANLPPKERLAQSVARGRAMAAASDVA